MPRSSGAFKDKMLLLLKTRLGHNGCTSDILPQLPPIDYHLIDTLAASNLPFNIASWLDITLHLAVIY